VKGSLLALTALALAYATPGHALKSCKTYYREPLPDHRHRVDSIIDAAAVDFAKRDFDAGRHRLDKALEKHADSTAIQFWLNDAIGASFLMEGRFADAASVFSRSAALPGLNFRGRFEAVRKLAAAHSRGSNHPAAIAVLEQMRTELCAPLAGQPAHLLAVTYLHEKRIQEAEEALAPLLADAHGVRGSDVRSLDFRIQCAHGRARPCVERFVTLQGLREVTEVDAGWFSRLLPAIDRSNYADDLLTEARSKGWIDSANQAVPNAPPQSASTQDSLIPLLRKAPQYPRPALQARISGSVLLSVVVGPDGNVAWVSVLDSNPPGLFDEAALEAISTWKFKPKVVDGVPVESSGIQKIDFQIERD